MSPLEVKHPPEGENEAPLPVGGLGVGVENAGAVLDRQRDRRPRRPIPGGLHPIIDRRDLESGGGPPDSGGVAITISLLGSAVGVEGEVGHSGEVGGPVAGTVSGHGQVAVPVHPHVHARAGIGPAEHGVRGDVHPVDVQVGHRVGLGGGPVGDGYQVTSLDVEDIPQFEVEEAVAVSGPGVGVDDSGTVLDRQRDRRPRCPRAVGLHPIIDRRHLESGGGPPHSGGVAIAVDLLGPAVGVEGEIRHSGEVGDPVARTIGGHGQVAVPVCPHVHAGAGIGPAEHGVGGYVDPVHEQVGHRVGLGGDPVGDGDHVTPLDVEDAPQSEVEVAAGIGGLRIGVDDAAAVLDRQRDRCPRRPSVHRLHPILNWGHLECRRGAHGLDADRGTVGHHRPSGLRGWGACGRRGCARW